MGETIEIWKPVVGYEGLYEVSNTGKVRSIYRYCKELKQTKKTPYRMVQLWKDHIGKYCTVHRLVAMAFIPNENNYPQVNHKDENKLNNHVSNLEWCTAKYNQNYGTVQECKRANTDYSKPFYAENARINGKKTCRPVKQFTKAGEFVARYDSIHNASVTTGINESHIGECCKKDKRYKSAGGYVWEYERG